MNISDLEKLIPTYVGPGQAKGNIVFRNGRVVEGGVVLDGEDEGNVLQPTDWLRRVPVGSRCVVAILPGMRALVMGGLGGGIGDENEEIKAVIDETENRIDESIAVALEKIDETARNLTEAQEELADARAEAEQNFGTLDDKLGQAFPDNVFDVDLAIQAAMSMANGKNSASYTDVSNSVAEPGPTPTLAMGAGRRQFDVHRNRRSNGQIIGEWVWTGSAWSRLELSDAMLSSLDVGKLTAGAANIETAVVNKLWGQLGVFDKLDVRTDAYVSGINLKDGAVTARTLNVVPDAGTGGLEIIPAGISIIPPEGEAGTAIQMRVDNESWIQFAQGGESTFSVSPEGDLVSKTVSANDSLVYRGSELADLVGSGGQGIVSSAVARINKDLVLDGSERSLMKVNVPPRDASLGRRCFAIRFQMATSRPDHIIGVRVRQTQDGSEVTVNSALYYDTRVHGQSGLISGTVIANLAADTDWNILLSCWSDAGGSIKAEIGTYFYVEDLGPAVPWDIQTPVSGGGTETTPTPTPVKTYTKTFSPTWTRSYLGGGGFYNYGAGRAYHGYYLAQNGILGSGVGFSRSEISQFIGSGTVTKVEIYVKNSHSYSSSGMTAYWGVHSKTSVPATWSLSAGTQSTAFKKGEGKWITLPSSMWAGWKTSTSGVFFRPPSTSLNTYGYFDGNATRVRITVQK